MGINVVIDEKLVKQVRKLTGLASDSKAIEQVLQRVVAGQQKHKDLLDLVGKVEFHEGFDPKKLRS